MSSASQDSTQVQHCNLTLVLCAHGGGAGCSRGGCSGGGCSGGGCSGGGGGGGCVEVVAVVVVWISASMFLLL